LSLTRVREMVVARAGSVRGFGPARETLIEKRVHQPHHPPTDHLGKHGRHLSAADALLRTGQHDEPFSPVRGMSLITTLS